MTHSFSWSAVLIEPSQWMNKCCQFFLTFLQNRSSSSIILPRWYGWPAGCFLRYWVVVNSINHCSFKILVILRMIDVNYNQCVALWIIEQPLSGDSIFFLFYIFLIWFMVVIVNLYQRAVRNDEGCKMHLKVHLPVNAHHPVALWHMSTFVITIMYAMKWGFEGDFFMHVRSYGRINCVIFYR